MAVLLVGAPAGEPFVVRGERRTSVDLLERAYVADGPADVAFRATAVAAACPSMERSTAPIPERPRFMTIYIRAPYRLFVLVGFAALSHCAVSEGDGKVGGSRAPETTAQTEQAETWGANAGFMPFGGAYNLCLAAVNNVIAAGSRLESVSCELTEPALGWVVKGAWPNQTISPQTDTSLCIDPGSGFPGDGPFLEPCTGNFGQQFALESGQIETSLGGSCLDVVGGSPVSGAGIDIAYCNGTQEQDFWSFGIPITLGAENDESACVDTPTVGDQPTIESCDSFTTTPSPTSFVYYGTAAHQLTQGNPSLYPELYNCLTLTGYSRVGDGEVAMEPCNYPATANQQWGSHLVRIDNVGHGSYQVSFESYDVSRTHLGSECLYATGAGEGALVGTFSCDSGNAEQAFVVPTYPNFD
jgi:Ricin-type beta-trefoil lectin domain